MAESAEMKALRKEYEAKRSEIRSKYSGKERREMLQATTRWKEEKEKTIRAGEAKKAVKKESAALSKKAESEPKKRESLSKKKDAPEEKSTAKKDGLGKKAADKVTGGKISEIEKKKKEREKLLKSI